MEMTADLEKKVEQMKADSENAAEALIRLRTQTHTYEARNQALTQQVAQYVQRSREQEHLLSNVQREILQLKEEVEKEADSNNYSRRDFSTLSLPAQQIAFHSTTATQEAVIRNALLHGNFANDSGNGGNSSSIAEVGQPTFIPSSGDSYLTIDRGALLGNHLSNLTVCTPSATSGNKIPFYDYFSEALLQTTAYANLSNVCRLDMNYASPVMLAPSLSPPATTMPPRLHPSMHMVEEGASDYRSLGNTYPSGSAGVGHIEDSASNGVCIVDLFGDEVERLSESKPKRSRNK